MISFILNDLEYTTGLSQGAVTLDLLRKEAGLTGTKEGCREGDCGACTVLLGTPLQQGISYKAVNSCILPVGELQGRHLVTIEGISPEEGLSSLQKIFVDKGASQCGFCTPGIIMSLTGYLLGTLDPKAEKAVVSLAGNICRCTGYVSIRKAADSVSETTGRSPADSCHSREHLQWLVDKRILPAYFLDIEERLKSLRSYEPLGASGNSLVNTVTVAGGTDLFAVNAEKLKNTRLEFLSCRKGFNEITVNGDRITVSAGATVDDIIKSGIFKGNLEKSLGLVSSSQIRNRATVGGNIVNASPIGDLTIIFLALAAKLTISNGSQQRELLLKDFFKGYKNLDLSTGELLESLAFKAPDSGTRMNFEKVSMRKHLDIASVNTAAVFRTNSNTIENVNISAGGVAPIPLYLKNTSSALKGKPISVDTARFAVRTACSEVSPIDDVRGSAEYKKTLLGKLIAAHFIQLFPETINGEELL